MIDAHVHLLHNPTGAYNFNLLESIVEAAIRSNVDEIYLLEHTHHFYEFKEVYKPISLYNAYQSDWIARVMGGTVDNYLEFIALAKKRSYPIKIKFGLEVCYIPQTAHQLCKILENHKFDFLTGSVHYIDNWGFDHKAEFWKDIAIDKAYVRYYQIMIELIRSGIFSGLAHPDSIKCFGNYPLFDLTEIYEEIASLLKTSDMFAEQSGGLFLNYGFPDLGMNRSMLGVFKAQGVKIMTASDAHKIEHVGANIHELQRIIDMS